MFAQLIESRPIRRRSPAGVAVSIGLHGIIVAGAIISTAHATAARAPELTNTVLEYRTPVREPPTVTPRPRLPAAPSPLRIGPSIVSVPIDVPDFIPPVNPLHALINPDEPMEFRIGAGTRPGTAAPGVLSSAGVLLADQVEIPVGLDRRSPLPRFPQSLRNAGVEGMVRVSFVVDTLGRVELETVRVVESSHPAFALAVQATLPRVRFTPARIGGHAVRQLVEFPVQFRLDK